MRDSEFEQIQEHERILERQRNEREKDPLMSVFYFYFITCIIMAFLTTCGDS